MADTANSSAAGQAPQELRLTRILGAPRSLVFKAWTDPTQVARWWGPADSLIPFANGMSASEDSFASTCAGPTERFIR